MALLRLREVTQTYWRGGRPQDVLRNASLELDPGDFVAIYGARGAGKTTLLKVAAGFEQPDSGTVAFQGRDLSTLSRNGLTRLHHEEIAWVERSGPHSPDLPIGLHVALPLYDVVGRLEAHRRADVVLAKVGANRTTYMRWAELWDEDRIRVAIAQALVREPKILVLDDPTRGLGMLEREVVVALLRSAAEEAGIGVLMAAPDMPATLPATQVRMLTRGRLLAPASESNIVEMARYRRA